MRETLQQAVERLLTEPVGTEKTIIINTSDGLTGLPPGMHARQSRSRTVVVKTEEQIQADIDAYQAAKPKVAYSGYSSSSYGSSRLSELD